MLIVNDIFDAPQGEGGRLGTWSHFIRLQGCPVGCSWCDSKQTWAKDGKEMTEDELVAGLRDFPGQVVITGGEPFFQDIGSLVMRLRLLNLYIQIETSGFDDFKHSIAWLGHSRRVWVTWSPKANLDYKFKRPMLREYIYEAKIVVDKKMTDKIATDIIGRVTKNTYITLMPEGFPPTKKSYEHTLEIYNYLIENGYNTFTNRILLTDRLQCHYGVK